MNQRLAGFDVARAYAIFGMYIVNFNFSFGAIMAPQTAVQRFLGIFSGNSTAIFIICAGMGVALMTNRSAYSMEEKSTLKSKVLRRSWFLFAIGLLLYNWWTGDILHFYGGYMHLAALLLFIPYKYYLWLAGAVVAIYHVLLLFIPVETGWDFTAFVYTDFWTPLGFLRNTLFNGWNSMFPWFAYFLLGMWMGRLNWHDKAIRRKVFISGLFIFLLFQGVRFMAKKELLDPSWTDYIMAEYFPPFLPFMMITIGFALIVITVCMYLGEKFETQSWIKALQKTGQMTLSHYVIHLTIGMVLLASITGKQYSGLLEDEPPTEARYILMYSFLFFIASILFSVLWSRKFKNGPLEMLMRKIAG